MARESLMNQDGTRKSYAQTCKELEKQYHTSIVRGVSSILDYKGYKYSELHKFGCAASMGDCIAMRQTNGEFIRWESDIVYETDSKFVTFVFPMAMGNGSAYPQPTGQFDLYMNEGYTIQKLISFTVTGYNNVWEDEDGTRLYFEVICKQTGNYGKAVTLDEYIVSDKLAVEGFAYLRMPSRYIYKNRKALFTLKYSNPSDSRNWCRITSLNILSADIVEGIKKISSPKEHPKKHGYFLLYGDIHTHTRESHWLHGTGCGIGTRKENADYAKYVSCLDFFCLSEHEWQTDEIDWENIKRLNEELNENGKFVVLHGFEWTSYMYGHRNVYFSNCPSKVKAVFDAFKTKSSIMFGQPGSPEDPTPQQLWDWLDTLEDTDAITVAHHPDTSMFLLNYFDYYNKKYDRLVEVYSGWGTTFHNNSTVGLRSTKCSDFGIKKFLSEFDLGFIASSDSHDGHPGNSCISSHHPGIGNYTGSGKAVVLAEKFDRESIFAALKQRRCYAVTGAPIQMWFSVNEAAMGQELKAKAMGGCARINVEVKGTDTLKKIQIIKNGRELYSKNNIDSNEFCIDIIDSHLDVDENTSYYAVVVQEDDEMAWSSPVFCKA